MTKICAHHHIHKCGGTTVEALLKHWTGCSHIHVEARDNILLSFEEVSPLIEEIKVGAPPLISISSHTLRVPLNEDATWADLHVTLLRDPIARLRSAYMHVSEHRYGPEYASFNEYALISWNSNFQCRYLFEHLYSDFPNINNYLALDLLSAPPAIVDAFFQPASIELASFVKIIMSQGSRSRFYALDAIENMFLDLSDAFEICPTRFPPPSLALNKRASTDDLLSQLDIPRLQELHKLDSLLFDLVKADNIHSLQGLSADLLERLSSIKSSRLMIPAYEGMVDSVFLH